MHMPACRHSLFAICVVLLSLISAAIAQDPEYVVGTIDGVRMLVRNDRQPALYTADYGDCLGNSAINVTRFDAAYYKDNMTIIFHLAGETALKNETLMMNIGVFAYGENRFDLTFDPCKGNIDSACPARAGTPIEAAAIIPINQNDVAGIPELALSIPDFEGQAILRIFSNSTKNEIGCFAAQITNGYTFEQKAAVSSTLAVFTLLAVLSSFATAIYGSIIVDMRKHYAHSLSVSVVFAVWHHIFYSGALSMNWPNVLVAFWSNYAWAGGMIYSEAMQNTINNFIGSNKGNTSHVGAAGTGTNNPTLGGGVDLHQIYTRGLLPEALHIRDTLAKRHLVDASSGFVYYGQPVKPGLPLPGNFSGFAGTLATERIPASNAFMTGLLWLLILIGCVAVLIPAFKGALEGLSRIRLVERDRLAFFRAHYIAYTMAALLRTLLIGFFMMTFLTLFQFSYLALSGPVTVACVVFVGVVFGLGSVAAVACFSRIRTGKYVSEPDRLNIEKRRILKSLPWCRFSRDSKNPQSEDKTYVGSIPWWTIHAMAETTPIHDDEKYTKKFGWLASRYRRTRWWFFVIWLVYEFIRACFLAGASSQPTVQVFGLLAVELIAFIAFICLRPFEGQRLNAVAVYLLGFSKVSTAALSAAFDRRFGVSRIPATVIGIVIIVVQGLLTIALMITILFGAISSYMSVMRERDDVRPKRWSPIRKRYFEHMDFAVQDVPRSRPRPLSVHSIPEVPKTPYFEVKQVKRMAKVEDEDNEFMEEIKNDSSISQLLLPARNSVATGDRPTQRNRTGSLQSQASYSSLPRAARPHRPSWSTQDYCDLSGPGRHRALSNTMRSTSDGPNRPHSRAPPRIHIQTGSQERVDRQPSPFGANDCRSNTPALSSFAHSYDESNAASPCGRETSRLISTSRASSRPNLETRISEESIPAFPEKRNARETT